MPLNKEMLEILCCPVTKSPVKMLSSDKLDILNKLIAAGKVKNTEGNLVEAAVQEALITEDQKTIYRIDDEIPVMLVGSGIPVDQLEGF